MTWDRLGAPHRLRVLGASLGLSLLAACAPDYAAVRDWSVQARETLLPPASLRPAIGLAVAPPPPAEVTAEGREGAVLALQEAAAAWLGALAYIADDGLPRGRTNAFGPLAARVMPFDAEGAAAVDALGETLADGVRRTCGARPRRWRARPPGAARPYSARTAPPRAVPPWRWSRRAMRCWRRAVAASPMARRHGCSDCRKASCGG